MRSGFTRSSWQAIDRVNEKGTCASDFGWWGERYEDGTNEGMPAVKLHGMFQADCRTSGSSKHGVS